MTVHRPNRLVGVGDAFAQRPNEVSIELGDGIADGVRDIQGRGTRLDRVLQNSAQKIHIRAIAIFRRKLDVIAQVARKLNGQSRLLMHLLRRHAQLLLHVQRAGSDECVNAGAGRTLQGLGGTRDVAVIGSRQRTYGGLSDLVSNGLDRFEVAIARCGKSGLDHINPQALQLARNAQLLVLGHGRAR